MSDGRILSTVERAFQLARSGSCHSVNEIRMQLNAERHDRVHEHLGGTTIQRQLKTLLAGCSVKPKVNTDDDDDL